ncbi:MAG: hypothetical protein ACU85E_17180 [Gammaproteobacteria bacterium]
MGLQDTAWILPCSLDDSILVVDSLEYPIGGSQSKNNLRFVNSHLKLLIESNNGNIISTEGIALVHTSLNAKVPAYPFDAFSTAGQGGVESGTEIGA